MATKGNWKAYREVVRKGTKGWEDHLATTQIEKGDEPHQVVHSHLEKIYEGNQLPAFPFEQTPRSPDFTVDELQWAIDQGKGGKSTGGDGVPRASRKSSRGSKDSCMAKNLFLLHGRRQ